MSVAGDDAQVTTVHGLPLLQRTECYSGSPPRDADGRCPKLIVVGGSPELKSAAVEQRSSVQPAAIVAAVSRVWLAWGPLTSSQG